MLTFLVVHADAAGVSPLEVTVGQASDIDVAASLAVERCPADRLIVGVLELDHASGLADALYRYAG